MTLDWAQFISVRSQYGNLEKIVYKWNLYLEQRPGKTRYGKAYEHIVSKMPIKWYREFKDMKYTGNVLLKSRGKFQLRTKPLLSDWINTLKLPINV